MKKFAMDSLKIAALIATIIGGIYTVLACQIGLLTVNTL